MIAYYHYVYVRYYGLCCYYSIIVLSIKSGLNRLEVAISQLISMEVCFLYSHYTLDKVKHSPLAIVVFTDRLLSKILYPFVLMVHFHSCVFNKITLFYQSMAQFAMWHHVASTCKIISRMLLY